MMVNPSLSLKPFAQWGIVLVFAGLCFWSGKWGLAAIYSYPAQMLVDYWSAQQKRGQPVNNERWQSAYAALRQAQALAPDDADIRFLIGQMHHYQAIGQPAWSAIGKKHWQQALEAYHTAVSLRPTWGYAWGLLAQAKLQSAAPIAQVTADWQRAITCAPHSFDTYQISMQIGFALWPLLSDQHRQQVKYAIAQLFARQGDHIIQLASKFHHLELLQPLLQQNPQWQKQYDAALQAK
ncbi:MAG: hypothetical protein HQM06_02435 [Magnetococcales bacterium]|nr:hypothetical protein [Magnetococcales bacterium]